jgi:hypothetical protein
MTQKDSTQRRLATIDGLAAALQDSSDSWVWQVATVIRELAQGTVSCEQAFKKLEE